MLSACSASPFPDPTFAIRCLERPLHRFAVRLTSRAEAEDITQETLARLFARGEFIAHEADPVMLRRVAFGYARKVAFECIRRRARTRSDDPSESSCSTDLPLVFALQRGFRELSQEDRELLWAADVEGVEQLEIAKRDGVPPGTIRSRVTRARQRLASWVDFGTATPPGLRGEVRR